MVQTTSPFLIPTPQRKVPPRYSLPTLAELLKLAPQQRASFDIAVMNMVCAEGLPGAEELNIGACLATLDRWTDVVKRYTRDHAGEYQRNPGSYHHHKGFFCFLSMATVLKHPRFLGIAYQPTAIGNFDFLDSRDDLLHGLLTRKLGTCASLPVLFTAIGRRLGYPMYLAVANGHVFCQWVSEDGSRMNLEGSCPGGGETHSDKHYHSWPGPLTREDLATGRYLRPLTRCEEFALFLETRGHCLRCNKRFDEAKLAYEQAGRVAPHWSPACWNIYRLTHNAAMQGYRLTFSVKPKLQTSLLFPVVRSDNSFNY